MIGGSFHIKSPNGQTSTVSEVNEIWHHVSFDPQTSSESLY